MISQRNFLWGIMKLQQRGELSILYNTKFIKSLQSLFWSPLLNANDFVFCHFICRKIERYLSFFAFIFRWQYRENKLLMYKFKKHIYEMYNNERHRRTSSIIKCFIENLTIRENTICQILSLFFHISISILPTSHSREVEENGPNWVYYWAWFGLQVIYIVIMRQWLFYGLIGWS